MEECPVAFKHEEVGVSGYCWIFEKHLLIVILRTPVYLDERAIPPEEFSHIRVVFKEFVKPMTPGAPFASDVPQYPSTIFSRYANRISNVLCRVAVWIEFRPVFLSGP
jgi:hypothetical protein